MSATHILLICGAAGVGKSSTAYEVAHRLRALDVAHAMIDSDELDRVHPWPPPGLPASELSRRNLAAIWSTFAALGHTRLLLTGVFVALAEEAAWIAEAVPGADVTVVRLTADLPTLASRIHRREIGSGAQAQLARTIRQLEMIDQCDPSGTTVIDTTGQTIATTAAQIIDVWLNQPGARG
ncbi:hypothetical protein CcI49_33170 [Frankia sp. CcI49]|uniref:hypothetical protein n=1 Tax=Frankia sp. CcI49 TaxID=1745382 RepID=UPI000977487C|nr:hypothetical protein [Frankia sp. CcI49]ONH52964.1 hypothetical protein CcI49_33170 [Frankia sp. CcI49]